MSRNNESECVTHTDTFGIEHPLTLRDYAANSDGNCNCHCDGNNHTLRNGDTYTITIRDGNPDPATVRHTTRRGNVQAD